MGTAERIPPHSLEAEQAVLGSIMLDNRVFDDVREILAAEDFYRPTHERIFAIMEKLRGQGKPIDALTVKERLDSSDDQFYLLELQNAVPTVLHVKSYAETVKTHAKLRSLITIGNNLMALGFDSSGPEHVDEYIGEAVSQTTMLALAHQHSAIPLGTVLEDLMREMRSGERHYLAPYNLPDARMRPGDLCVLGMGTSVGKTATALDWADDWSQTHKVSYYEYEMTEGDLLSRLVCKHAGITMPQIQDATLTDDDLKRAAAAMNSLRNRKLLVQEVWCDIGTLIAKIRRDAQTGTEIVMIDHLGLIPFKREKNQNEAKAIGYGVTQPLKRLASELGIIIVLLVQLNREGQRGSDYPKLRNLRDSGEIEQDASIVIMGWSEKLILDDSAERIKKREESLIVAPDELMEDSFLVFRLSIEKNRNGKAGYHKWLLYYGENFRFEDRGREYGVINVPVQQELVHDG
jgi:replicative DNA helicase